MAKVLKNVSKISGIYGQPGEERVSSLLQERLPDDYIILNSPRVSYHGATIDIDHVIIGPNGVFAIESKNMHGKILGGLMGNWTQERKRSGKSNRVKIGNPASQVNQYAKIVKSYLTVKYLQDYGNKVNVKLYPIVVFVHEEADLSEMEYTRPGFIGRVKVLKLDDLIDFILTREGVTYTPADIENFGEILVPPDQRDQTQYISTTAVLTEQKGLFSQRYEVLEEIGRGNFGTVYRGFDFKLDREVAIKKMHNKQKDPNAIRRFFREAQINAKLSHENIVAVFDYYEEDGDCFLIMEYVDGPTLEEYAGENQMGLPQIYEIVDDICAALEHAHEQHVVHRDLKPANILLGSDLKVKVSDFGIARLTEDSGLTQTSTTLGTPTVMAPEQILGQAVDARTDIFGIGVLLYLLLTGSYPFKGEHIGELVNKILYQEPDQVNVLCPEIPEAIAKVVVKCLQKEPDDRFSTVMELRQALRDVFIEAKDFSSSSEQVITRSLKTDSWSRNFPNPLKRVFSTDKRLFTAVSIISLVVILGLLGYQAFADSRRVTSDYLQTKQYGFTNENLKTLFANPDRFKGVPVSLVGKLGKIIKLNQSQTIFTMTVAGDQVPFKQLVVQYNKPHFMLQYSDYLKVTGSVQSAEGIKGYESVPVIIADKIEPIDDPWSILAPTIITTHPGIVKNDGGKVVRLDRVEFASQETRIFITVANLSKDNAYFVLSKPIGRQGQNTYQEVPNRYGVLSQPTLELKPGEYIEEVVFLKPLDPNQKTAKFIFGSDLNIADPEKPITFDVKW